MYMPAPVTMLIYRRNFFFLNFTLLNYLLGFL